jgi:hypothetical protein
MDGGEKTLKLEKVEFGGHDALIKNKNSLKAGKTLKFEVMVPSGIPTDRVAVSATVTEDGKPGKQIKIINNFDVSKAKRTLSINGDIILPKIME